MGWCHEFGSQIRAGCGHPMRAGENACVCPECGVVCTGKFAACDEVWARGPREVHLVAQPLALMQRKGSLARVPPPVVADPSPDTTVDDDRREVLSWLQAAFDGLRDELVVVAGGLARQQSVLADLGASRSSDLDEAVAEVRQWGGELRNETIRLQGFGKAVAEQLRDDVTNSIAAGVTEMTGTRDNELRQALAEVEVVTSELRQETARLQDFGADLSERLRAEVMETVRQSVAGLAESQTTDVRASLVQAEGWTSELREETARLQQFGETLAENLRDAVAVALQQAKTAPAPAAGVVEEGSVPDDAEAPARASARGGRRQAAAHADMVPAVELPSGSLVAASLAAVVDEALEAARVRRRRQWQPAPPKPGLHRQDPLVNDVVQRLGRFAKLTPRPSAVGNGPRPVPVGVRDGAEVSVDPGDLNGVALTGGAAPHVAHALITAFVATRRPPAEVVIVGNGLLSTVPSFPGLRRAPSLAEAVVTAAGAQGRPERLVVACGPLADGDTVGEAVDEAARQGVTVLLLDAQCPGRPVVTADPPGELSAAVAPAWMEEGATLRAFCLTGDEAAEVLDVVASSRHGAQSSWPESDAEVCHVRDWVVLDGGRREEPLVRVELLGRFCVEAQGAEVRSGLRTKARELLAFHLLHPEGATVEAMVDALWPEADTGRGSEWFWTALGNLRSRLRAASGQSELKVIDRVDDLYRIEAQHFDVDLWRFEEALEAMAGAGDDAAMVAALQRAADEYGGDLLAGDEWQWAQAPRDDVRHRAVDVLAALAELRLRAGDAEAGLVALEQALQAEPLAEELYRRAMTLHARLSRPDGVRGLFRLLQARLAAVGEAPAPPTEQLFAQLVRG
jgi:DNA-binding SARP family transcriptional activator